MALNHPPSPPRVLAGRGDARRPPFVGAVYRHSTDDALWEVVLIVHAPGHEFAALKRIHDRRARVLRRGLDTLRDPECWTYVGLTARALARRRPHAPAA
jgi:hypothetical protein